jgi:hypothetical protein
MEVVEKKSDLCVLSLETNVKYNIHVLDDPLNLFKKPKIL